MTAIIVDTILIVLPVLLLFFVVYFYAAKFILDRVIWPRLVSWILRRYERSLYKLGLSDVEVEAKVLEMRTWVRWHTEQP